LRGAQESGNERRKQKKGLPAATHELVKKKMGGITTCRSRGFSATPAKETRPESHGSQRKMGIDRILRAIQRRKCTYVTRAQQRRTGLLFIQKIRKTSYQGKGHLSRPQRVGARIHASRGAYPSGGDGKLTSLRMVGNCRKKESGPAGRIPGLTVSLSPLHALQRKNDSKKSKNRGVSPQHPRNKKNT